MGENPTSENATVPAADTIGRGPPKPGGSTGIPRQEDAHHVKLVGESYSTGKLAANGNLKQSKAEDLVRKYLAGPIRRDALIPCCLRTLESAQRELCHDGLALAISASEWSYVDLMIWNSYPADFARAEAWKHIGIGIGWIQYLRRRRGPPPHSDTKGPSSNALLSQPVKRERQEGCRSWR